MTVKVKQVDALIPVKPKSGKHKFRTILLLNSWEGDMRKFVYADGAHHKGTLGSIHVDDEVEVIGINLEGE